MATSLTSSPGTRAPPSSTYRVLVACELRDQLKTAPPALRGTLLGMVAVLRVDPLHRSFAFETRLVGEHYRMAMLPGGGGFLGYLVLEDLRVLLLLNLGLA